MKIKNIKKAISDYKWANSGGYYSSRYGNLMFDKSTGELWTDEFCDFGHSWFVNYRSDDIVDIVREMNETNPALVYNEGVTMKSVKKFIMENYPEFA